MTELFRHENQACPLAPSDGGSLRLDTNYDLLTCLEDLYDAKSEAPAAACVVLDGTVTMQMTKPAAAKNCDGYAQVVFIPYLSTKLLTASCMYLVWDSYVADLLK